METEAVQYAESLVNLFFSAYCLCFPREGDETPHRNHDVGASSFSGGKASPSFPLPSLSALFSGILCAFILSWHFKSMSCSGYRQNDRWL